MLEYNRLRVRFFHHVDFLYFFLKYKARISLTLNYNDLNKTHTQTSITTSLAREAIVFIKNFVRSKRGLYYLKDKSLKFKFYWLRDFSI
ncbi:hypothetical protein HanPI659440_Chr13g0490341 [Helianthus annuus]|nr:hypothetical protein HanPI659440_Chr13g0490341 [Helianthus annuus]